MCNSDRAVLIVFIDCFYSCWKRISALAEDDVDLWKCAAIALMSEEAGGGVYGWIVQPPSFRSQELTELCATLQPTLETTDVSKMDRIHTERRHCCHFKVLSDFRSLVSFPFVVWADLLCFLCLRLC